MGERDHRNRHTRRSAAGLAAGAMGCVLLAAGSVQRSLVLLASVLLIGAVGVYRRTVKDEPYSYWVAWAAAAILTLLYLWAQPPQVYDVARLLALPWAATSALVAAVLFLRWRTHRDGHLDWVVDHPDLGVLRREPTKGAATAWARHFGGPCRIFRLDIAPELSEQTPLYPFADRSAKQVSRSGGAS